MEMLTLSHVSKFFGSKKVVDDISFSVQEGTVFGFIGQNGAGKTTSMKMILGLLQMDSGEIFVHGEKVSYGQNKTNQYIGYLPDVPEFYNFMTPKEYLTLCGEITGLSKNKTFIAIITLVTSVQIIFIYLGGSLLRTAPLTLRELGFTFLIALSVIPLELLRKLFLRFIGVRKGF